jgi:hypothetical protein
MPPATASAAAPRPIQTPVSMPPSADGFAVAAECGRVIG